MKNRPLFGPLCLLVSALVGCDGQQYVAHDTARLTISDADTGAAIVSACDYIPVLLGAYVEKTYVADDLHATISLSRTDIVVAFQGSGAGTEPFRVTVAELEAAGLRAADPPPGYNVELGSGCAPDY
jgi:hypothetical protein